MGIAIMYTNDSENITKSYTINSKPVNTTAWPARLAGQRWGLAGVANLH